MSIRHKAEAVARAQAGSQRSFCNTSSPSMMGHPAIYEHMSAA